MGKYTKAEEDYLEAIYMLGGADGGVQSVAVSVKLGVSKPAVNMATNDLAKKGLIEKQRYGDLTLTKEGRTVAEEVYARHTLLKQLLIYIGVSEETAENDCCKIEHTLSAETVEKLRGLKEKLGF